MQYTPARAGGVQPVMGNGPSKSLCARRMVPLFVIRLAHGLGEHQGTEAGRAFLVDRTEARLVAPRQLARSYKPAFKPVDDKEAPSLRTLMLAQAMRQSNEK